jgi:hypothetical protein
MAASVCVDTKSTPRGLYQNHFDKLESLMLKGVGNASLPFIQNYNQGGTLMQIKK